MQTGLKISLAGHGTLILVGLLGWPFAGDAPPEPLGAVDVTLISAAELSPGALAETPAQPETVDLPAVPEPETPAAPAQPEPVPTPDPVPEPDLPVEAEATPPPPVDRVAPVPQPQLPEDLPEAPERQEAVEVVPDPSPEVIEAEEQEAAAPEAAAPEIVTEATETSLAPVTSPVPRPRPQRPVPAVDPVPEPEPEPEPQPAPEDPLASALAEALAEPDADPGPAAAAGPPLTQGERDGLRVSVGRCWNFSALGTDAAKVTVVVGMDMSRDGVPSNLRMISWEGGGEAAARQAYETARRAILRCQPYALPAEKYDQWQSIEMTFNPERMRRK